MQFPANKSDRYVRPILLAFLALGCVSFIAGLTIRGSHDDRFAPGGLSLALAAMMGGAAQFQIRTGKIPVRESRWSRQIRWVDKRERPIHYWFTSIMYVVCSVMFLVYSILIFAYSMEILRH